MRRPWRGAIGGSCALPTSRRSTASPAHALPAPARSKIDPGLKSLENVDSATMVASVSRCLKVITEGEATFNESLPPSMAARHRICQGLAQHVKVRFIPFFARTAAPVPQRRRHRAVTPRRSQRLGFSGECGFNQLLYPNAKDARKLLMFLVEKLPKEEADGTGEPLDRRALLNRALVSAAKAAATRPWAPHVFSSRTGANPRALDRLPLAHFHSVPLVIPPTRTAAKRASAAAVGTQSACQRVPILTLSPSVPVSSSEAAYFRRHVPAVTAQAPRAPELAASLAEREAVALGLQSAQEKAADAEGGEGDASLRSGSSALTDAGAARVRALLAASLADTTLGLGSDGAAGGGQAGGPGGSGASGSDGDGATLADLVASFRSRGLQGGSDRSTAFANRQHFTQEQSAPSTEVAAALQAAKEAEEKDAAAEEEVGPCALAPCRQGYSPTHSTPLLTQRQNKEIEGLDKRVQAAREQAMELARKRDAAIATVRGLEADVQGAREQSSELEKSYKLKKRVIEVRGGRGGRGPSQRNWPMARITDVFFLLVRCCPSLISTWRTCSAFARRRGSGSWRTRRGGRSTGCRWWKRFEPRRTASLAAARGRGPRSSK